jgi:hypothetical protein
MKNVLGSGGIAPTILNLVVIIGGGEQSASLPGCFISEEKRPPSAQEVGLIVDLDHMEKKL